MPSKLVPDTSSPAAANPAKAKPLAAAIATANAGIATVARSFQWSTEDSEALRSSALPSERKIQSCISPWLTPAVYPLLRHLVVPSFFGDITITGQEHLPRCGPVILAPTHRSRWDALVVPYATGRHVTGRDLRFMVTADEVTGFQGALIRQLGGFPVNPRQPAIASLRFGLDILKNREMMVIFPEGAIFRDRVVHPLRPGLARLALQAEQSDPSLNVQIVPIDLNYHDAVPSWGTDIAIKIGQPLSVKDYCGASMTAKASAKGLTAALTQALTDLL